MGCNSLSIKIRVGLNYEYNPINRAHSWCLKRKIYHHLIAVDICAVFELVCSGEETAEIIIKFEYCSKEERRIHRSRPYTNMKEMETKLFSPSETVTRRLRIKRVSAKKAI